MTEPRHTWCVGKRSVLAIDNVVAPFGFFLEIDWQPFVMYPYLLDQAVSITVLDHRISPYRVAERETAAFYCPQPSPTDKKVLITFEHLDAAKIADYIETTDPREVAIAFLRVRILPLDHAPPARIRNNSASKVLANDGELMIPRSQGAAKAELRLLLTRFEALSGNCDMGLAMRALGFEQLSLLRFAGATTDVAIRGLETDFEGIGVQLAAEIADNPMKEWMVRDAFGLRFHTHQSSEAMPEAEILKRQQQHIQFLRRKFLEDLQVDEKIFVHSDHIRPRTFESALALFLALNRRGKHRMLWVCPNLGDMVNGRVDELLPGLARGALDIFDGPMEAGHITVAGWVNVLFNAAVVLDRNRGFSA